MHAGWLIVLCTSLVAADTTDHGCRGSTARYVDAVRRFADGVLRHGRDVYGKKHTPLFADGLQRDSLEPVEWKKNGTRWILSNLASQQNLFRTFDGLSRLTQDPKYRQAAVGAVKYAFANLRSPNGLLYWGGHTFYDLRTDRVVGEGNRHELKRHFPYYPLFWKVDAKVTKKLLESFWMAHILRWSNLDMNRHGSYTRQVPNLWDQRYEPGEIFFLGDGLTFCNTGSDLIYAGTMLYLLAGEKPPLVWAQRMASRYDETRNSQTGLVGYQYSRIRSDRAQRQFGPEFGGRALDATILPPSLARVRYAIMGICEMKLAEAIGAGGLDFVRWASRPLLAYAKHAYDPKTNTFKPMFTDGTPLSPHDVRRSGYYSREKMKPLKARGMYFWAYALAFRLTRHPLHWQMVGHLGQAHELGQFAMDVTPQVTINVGSLCSDPHILIGLLELYQATRDEQFMTLAVRVADNIIADRTYNGFFVPSKRHLNVKFDALEPLALLRLVATLDNRVESVPEPWPGESYYHDTFDGVGRAYDNGVIYHRRQPAKAHRSGCDTKNPRHRG